MALSNSQYDHLMRTYEQKQLDNEFQLRKRYEKAYALIPELEEMDHSIAGMRFCPECGAPVVHEGGCVICRQCGYSKCG